MPLNPDPAKVSKAPPRPDDQKPLTAPMRVEAMEPMRFRLRVVNETVQRIDLVGDEATIGCGDATVRVPPTGGVSRVHLKLFQKHNRWSFTDVSTNGVYELDALGVDTGQKVHGVDFWAPGRGYRIGLTELWMEAYPTSDQRLHGFHGLIGESEAMQTLQKLIKRVGPREMTVILHGPSGSGKELVAAAIHKLSARAGKELHAVNCAQIRGDLAASALFGHVKGAFTGADRDLAGMFAKAEGSTLFLDEVAELEPTVQATLLRVLETGEYTPVGSHEKRRTNVRIIVASHQHLGEMVRRGQFRDDLHARLNVVTIRVPPLAERTEDIPALIEHFTRKVEPHRKVTWSKAAIALVQAQPLGHNVRNIRNIVTRTLAFHPQAVIERDMVELDEVVAPAKATVAEDDLNYVYLPDKTMEEVKEEVIRKALLRIGTQQATADALQVSPDTIQRRLGKMRGRAGAR